MRMVSRDPKPQPMIAPASSCPTSTCRLAGIASVIYEIVFKKHIVKRTDKIPVKKIFMTIIILSAIFFDLF